MSPKRRFAIKKSKVTLIAQGKEGKIYRHSERRNVAIKKYFPYISKSAFDQHVNFLRANGNSGVVPKLYVVDSSKKVIEMEYLHDFMSLIEALSQIKRGQSKFNISQLILALQSARSKLCSEYDYSDLSNFRNIGVKFREQIQVKFFEGGKAIPMPIGTRDTVPQLWLKKVVYEMRVSRNSFARAILSNKSTTKCEKETIKS